MLCAGKGRPLERWVDHREAGHGRRGEPGSKNMNPRAISPSETQQSSFLLPGGLPCERTQHGKGLCDICLFLFLHTRQTRLLQHLTLPPSNRHGSLRSNNYRHFIE
jgi:hypothetical protein